MDSAISSNNKCIYPEPLDLSCNEMNYNEYTENRKDLDSDQIQFQNTISNSMHSATSDGDNSTQNLQQCSSLSKIPDVEFKVPQIPAFTKSAFSKPRRFIFNQNNYEHRARQEKKAKYSYPRYPKRFMIPNRHISNNYLNSRLINSRNLVTRGYSQVNKTNNSGNQKQYKYPQNPFLFSADYNQKLNQLNFLPTPSSNTVSNLNLPNSTVNFQSPNPNNNQNYVTHIPRGLPHYNSNVVKPLSIEIPSPELFLQDQIYQERIIPIHDKLLIKCSQDYRGLKKKIEVPMHTEQFESTQNEYCFKDSQNFMQPHSFHTVNESYMNNVYENTIETKKSRKSIPKKISKKEENVPDYSPITKNSSNNRNINKNLLPNVKDPTSSELYPFSETQMKIDEDKLKLDGTSTTTNKVVKNEDKDKQYELITAGAVNKGEYSNLDIKHQNHNIYESVDVYPSQEILISAHGIQHNRTYGHFQEQSDDTKKFFDNMEEKNMCDNPTSPEIDILTIDEEFEVQMRQNITRTLAFSIDNLLKYNQTKY